ncbi:MAG: hypothetical protein F9K24_12245 [Leptonema illini]|uniref:Uncharacterized protein n=1 Tax=Leptonema illini TaxID=183 RepID=A0A833M1B6_9LEPT|nr:MAG: hypothetical protein F9K24_12245 [Leptonema illini]PKL33512.1 MAG: hypothetical protein CVV45_07265 [Spirochaetae bacterium HGW-Spirochaetae-10]
MVPPEKDRHRKNAAGICQCSGCGKKTTQLYQNNLCRECLSEKFKSIRGFIDETRSRIFETSAVKTGSR